MIYCESMMLSGSSWIAAVFGFSSGFSLPPRVVEVVALEVGATDKGVRIALLFQDSIQESSNCARDSMLCLPASI
ncbi:hypothetical protein WDV93_16630 [Pantoea ananatis]